MQYYVQGNLNHDGKGYTTGDTVELSGTNAEALLASGVINLTSEPPHVNALPTEEAPADAEAIGGGVEDETGEPALDGQTEQQADTTPEVAAPTEEAPAKKKRGAKPTEEAADNL